MFAILLFGGEAEELFREEPWNSFVIDWFLPSSLVLVWCEADTPACAKAPEKGSEPFDDVVALRPRF